MAENTYAFDTTDFQLALQTIAFVLLIIVPIDEIGFKLIAIEPGKANFANFWSSVNVLIATAKVHQLSNPRSKQITG